MLKNKSKNKLKKFWQLKKCVYFCIIKTNKKLTKIFNKMKTTTKKHDTTELIISSVYIIGGILLFGFTIYAAIS